MFHLAAILSTRAELSPKIAHNININGTINIFELALKQSKSQNKRSYTSVRVSKTMIEKESVKYLHRLRNLRPDLQIEIDALLFKLTTEEMKEVDDFGFSLTPEDKEYL